MIGLLTATDEELLTATDAASFEQFYRRHFESVLAFFARRTRDPELAADLCAETFAAALLARRRYRPGRGRADSWLFSIAYRKLSDTRRRGRAEDRALRRLGAEALTLADDDVAWIEHLAGEDRAVPLVAGLPVEQRDAIRAHVVDERDYDDIAASTRTSPGRGPQARQSRTGCRPQAPGRERMSLEDRLWEALEPAAMREAHRPRFTLPHIQPRAFRTAAAVLIALAALFASAALIALLARPASHTAAPAPSKVKTARVGTGLSDAATGFGSVWMYDAGDQRLLRVDPARRRVLEWVSVPSPFVDVAIATGAGAVWAVPVQNTGHVATAIPSRPLPLVRIDPQNGRTVARVPVRDPGGRPILPFGVETGRDAVWVWGQTAALRIDPHTNRVTQAIPMPNDPIKGFAIDGGDVWIATEGQRLLRFDARTGARKARFPGRPLTQPTSLVVLPHAIVIDGEHGTLYARDRATGRMVWEAHLPSTRGRQSPWETASGSSPRARLGPLTSSSRSIPSPAVRSPASASRPTAASRCRPLGRTCGSPITTVTSTSCTPDESRQRC